MKIIIVTGVFLLWNWTANSSLLDPVIENVRHIKVDHPPEKVDGIWKKKILWKSRWVKQWKSENVLKPVWRKFWGPVIIREWVPIPKPPPDWDPHSASNGKKLKPISQGPAYPDVGDPPEPNLNYLKKPPASSGYNYDPPKQSNPNSVLGHVHGNLHSGDSGGSLNFQTPLLPISNGYNSQAESYTGHPSYGNHGDSAYDLNPPVESYTSHHVGGYNYQSGYNHHAGSTQPTETSQTTVGYIPNNQISYHQVHGNAAKPSGSNSQSHHDHHHHHHHQPQPSHHHHHHHHHGNPSTHVHVPDSHGFDLTKFPPIWNSWESLPSKSNTHASNLLQEASSAVSVVSKLHSTTPKPNGFNSEIIDYLTPPYIQTGNSDFIQASLISEYHYTDSAPVVSTQSPPQITVIKPLETRPNIPNQYNNNSPHNETNEYRITQPQLPVHPQKLPNFKAPPANAVQTPNFKPLPSSTVQTPTFKPPPGNSIQAQNLKPVPSSTIRTPVFKPPPGNSIQAQNLKPVPSSTIRTPVFKPPPGNTVQTPNFKALPATTFQTFHFEEPVLSSQTKSELALLVKFNQTIPKKNHQINQVSIATPKPAPSIKHQKQFHQPSVEKLANGIVQQHLQIMQRPNATTVVPATAKPVINTTERTTAPVILSTSSSIKKTLKDILHGENSSEKSPKVFIVTPIPQKKAETH